MPSFKQPIAVEMEDGETWEVIADQRDLARWEVSPLHGEDRAHTFVRHLAWTASFRNEKTRLKWGTFDATCIFAGDPEGGAEEIPVDPTQPGQPDES